MGATPTGKVPIGGESPARTNRERGDGGVIFIDRVDVAIIGQYVHGHRVITHREERVGAVRKRGAQASRGAKLSVGIDGIDDERSGPGLLPCSPAGIVHDIEVGAGLVDRQLGGGAARSGADLLLGESCRSC